MLPARHLLIVNPKAGRGRALEASWRVERLYREAGLDFALTRTTGPGHAAALAREGAAQFAAVVALGGDGTLHEVVSGLADAAAAAPGGADPGRIAALGSIPIGTGNDFVKSLAIRPEIDAGFAVVRAGRRRRIDLGRAGPLRAPGRTFEREWFANDFSAGFGALVVKDMVEPPFFLRFFTGHLAYLLVGILRALHKAEPMTLRIAALDGAVEERRGRFYEVHVGNGRFCGGGIQFTPRAELDDGLLDLTTIEGIARWRFVDTMSRKVRHGTLVHAPESGVRFGRLRRIEIEHEGTFSTYVDGEHRYADAPAGGGPARVTVEVVPAALDVLAP